MSDWLDELFANHTDEEIVAGLERSGVRMSAFDAENEPEKDETYDEKHERWARILRENGA